MKSFVPDGRDDMRHARRARTPHTALLMVLPLVGALAACSDGSSGVSQDAATVGEPDVTVGGSEDVDHESKDVAADDEELCPDRPPVHCLLEELTADHVDPDYTPGKAIGLVVGVARPGARYVTGFGARTLGGSEPPDASSIFDIASVTKLYSGYLLARGVENGELQLDDTLEKTFGTDVPTYSGRSIDLLDLATHTSGLPNYPNNLLFPGPVNPTRDYTLPLLEEFLASHTLTVEPSTSFVYSNLGTGILGHTLVTASGEASFDALVQREIAGPHGLPDTAVTLSTEQQERKMQGYADGEPAPAVDIGEPLQGGGALRATGDDLLRFFEAAIDGTDPTWDTVMTPRRDSPNGMNARTGLFLNVEDLGTHNLYSKNGGAPGFSSQVTFTVDPPLVVVLLSNMKATERLYPLSRTILEELATFAEF